MKQGRRRFYLRAVIVMWLGLLSGIVFAWSSDGGLRADDMTKNRAELSPADAWSEIKAGSTLIDVRTPEEFADGHLPGALNINHTEIAKKIGALNLSKSAPVVLYCRSGRRSGIAQQTLEGLGFEHAYNAGSYEELAAAKQP